MTTLVAAHDAGGAEVLSSWAKREERESLYFWLDGPALEIFERKLGSGLRQSSAWSSIAGLDLVVSGTGNGEWERNAIRVARSSHIRCVAWLDHWTRYAERFDVSPLPNEIWVCDVYAYDLAVDQIPSVPVFLQGNPYLSDVRAEIAKIERAQIVDQDGGLGSQGDRQRSKHVLVVFDRGRDLLHLKRFGNANQYVRRLRPHPADVPPKRSLAEDVAWADIVVGWDSMALVVALKAGRRVYSVLSPEERTIPYEGIAQL